MDDLIVELGEPSRRLILAELITGPRSVSELVDSTGLKQPNISNHLARMRSKGIVRATKIGRSVFYSLDSPEVEERILEVLRPAPPDAAPQDLADCARQFAKEACAGNDLACFKLIDALLVRGHTLIELYDRVLGAALEHIGRWYEVEAIDVSHEHVASEIALRAMSRIVHFASPVKRIDETALLGCCEGNWHSIGLRMLSDYLRLTGWTTYFLGANVPNRSFLIAVEDRQPDLVMVSCSVEEQAPRFFELLDALNQRKAPLGFVLCAGGPYAISVQSELAKHGVDLTAKSLAEFDDQMRGTAMVSRKRQLREAEKRN
jgi:methanogenic corrinoid protein MtbC1